MDDNKKEKQSNEQKDLEKQKKENAMDKEIQEAQKEMEDLMKSMQEELGASNVKVVKLQLPKATVSYFFFGLFFGLLVNVLLIVGTSGFINYLTYENVLDLVLYALYFTVVERVIDIIFVRFFTPLIIRTMGLASFIPIVLSLAIVIIFPIFISIENILATLLTLVFICVCRNTIMSYLRNKLFFRKGKGK